MSQNAKRKQLQQEEQNLQNRSQSKKKRNQQNHKNQQKIVDINVFKQEPQKEIDNEISKESIEQLEEREENSFEANDTEITTEQIEANSFEANDTEITKEQIQEVGSNTSDATTLTKKRKKKKEKKEMIIIEASQTRMTKKKKQAPKKQESKLDISKDSEKEPQKATENEVQKKQEPKANILKDSEKEPQKEVLKKEEAKANKPKEAQKELPKQVPLSQVSYRVEELKTTTNKADTAMQIFSKAEPEKIGLYTKEEIKERAKAKRLEIREQNKAIRKERRELRRNPIIPEDETPKQARRRVRKEKRKRRRRRFVLNTARNVTVMAISVYGGYYAFHAYNTYKSNQMYEEIARSVIVNGEAVLSVEALRTMKAQYEDYEGYIHIPDTNLSYPLMKTTKEKGFYYLTRDIENKATTLGTPFVDYRVNVRNIYNQVIIYGTIPDQGEEMFHVLTQYKDPEFMQAHNPIYIANDEHKISFYEFVWAVDVPIDDPDAIGWLDSLQPHEEEARAYFKALYEKADLISDAYMYQQTHQYMTLVGILPEDKGYTLVCFEKGYGL